MGEIAIIPREIVKYFTIRDYLARKRARDSFAPGSPVQGRRTTAAALASSMIQLRTCCADSDNSVRSDQIR